MIATDFKLIPNAVLFEREDIVRRRLETLPLSYRRSLLDEPELRYTFLRYLLLMTRMGNSRRRSCFIIVFIGF
jgi:hypothetical protein